MSSVVLGRQSITLVRMKVGSGQKVAPSRKVQPCHARGNTALDAFRTIVGHPSVLHLASLTILLTSSARISMRLQYNMAVDTKTEVFEVHKWEGKEEGPFSFPTTSRHQKAFFHSLPCFSCHHHTFPPY